ncbi:MAG: alpha-isopropylmalate synthase regulatory domain-containing protein [bacterium]|nr:alpha-isopropylmalate synthase regulatory domain-containing protein [bacterium]
MASLESEDRVQQIKLYDTTLRDGSQSSDINFTLAEKLVLLREFDDFGFDYIEGGWPRPNSIDEDFFREAARIKLKNSKLAAFGSTKKIKGKPEDDAVLRSLVESGVQTATIFGKTWLHHVSNQLRATPEQNLEVIDTTIRYLHDNPVNPMQEVIYDAEHFFDGYKDDPEYALRTLKQAVLAGADAVVLCETNGGCIHYEVGEIVRRVKEFMESDGEIKKASENHEVVLGIHTHNDSGLAVASTIEAVRAGATHVQGTVNGLGERIGNANLNTIMAVLALKTSYKLPKAVRLEKLTALSEKVYRVAGLRPREDQPFCGEKAFAHDGGVHVDAVLKGASYQHIDPLAVGNKMRIVLSTNSGKASVMGVARIFGYEVDKDDPRLQAMLDEVHRQCAEGFNLGLLENEHELLTLKHFGEIKTDIEIHRCDVTSHYAQHEGDVEHDNSCVLKVRLNGKEYKVFEDDENGPVAISFKAVREALQKAGLPTNFRLVNYEVGLPKKWNIGAEAKIQVYITYATDDGELITTSGFHEDIVVASRESLIKLVLLLASRRRRHEGAGRDK